MPGFDQDHAGRIEAQGVETVAVRAAVVGEPFSRDNEQHRPARRHAAKQGCREAEGGRQIAGGLGCHLMQRTEGKAALGQVGIENGHPEGEGTPIRAQAFHLRDLAPQSGYGLGKVLVSFARHERRTIG
jgi:hypothetical protein